MSESAAVSESRVAEHDLLLLDFLLRPDAEAVRCWRRWAETAHIDDHTPAAFALLPAVYKRLEGLGEDHEWLGRLKGVHRRTWTQNQIQIRSAALGIDTLTGAGIDVLSDARHVLHSRSTRGEIGVLDVPRLTIPSERAAEALAALRDGGWSIDDSETAVERIRARLGRIQWKMRDSSGAAVILTARFDAWLWDARATEEVWTRATRSGDRCHIPAAGDLTFSALMVEMGHPSRLSWVLPTLTALDECEDAPTAHGLRYSPPEVRATIRARVELLERHLDDKGESRSIDIDVPQVAALSSGNPVLRKVRTARRLIDRWGGVRGAREYLRVSARSQTSGSDR